MRERPEEIIVEIATRLSRLRRTLGDRPFRDAAQRAKLAIATAAHAEAERRAGQMGESARKPVCTVVRFPWRDPPPPDDQTSG